MQFTIPRETILPVLGALSRTARPNGQMQQLGFVRITAKEGTLWLFATNLKWSVTYTVACAGITQPGQSAMPARLVTDFVGELPNGPLQFTWHPDTLLLDLDCRGYEAHLHGWNPEELPTPPVAGATPLTTLTAQMLRTLIESVRYAAADDATKSLSNVLFHFQAGQLTLVGADGFRLVVRQTDLDSLTLPASVETDDLQLLVPASVAAELASTLPEAKTGQEVPVTLSVTPDLHHLVCQAPGWEFASRLADGPYVDYARFVRDHEAGPTQVRFVTAELSKALRIAESFAADTHHSVVLGLLPAADPTEPGQIRLAAASERGSTVTLVDAVINGEAMRVAFNTRFLREALANLNNPHALLRLRDPLKPVLLTPAHAAGPDHLCLLMPLALASSPTQPARVPATPPTATPPPSPAPAIPLSEPKVVTTDAAPNATTRKATAKIPGTQEPVTAATG